MELKELKEFKMQIKDYDFFKEDKDTFFDGRAVESELVYGGYWEKEPMVTVIITTYKRPELLKLTLESALGQENFTDYQILVVDNEAAPLEQETETSRLMQLYKNNDKVIYYRNKVSANYKMDTAISYARSKWVCFLHDDDLLVKNHLAIMTDIINRYPKISFLGCQLKIFYDEVEDKEYENLVQPEVGNYSVVHYPRQYLCIGYVPSWLGALIDREKYIAIGGMPKVDTGIGDFIMQGKFTNKWGSYRCESSHGLYCYRQWRGQDSAKGESVWVKGYMSEYYWYKYLNKKFHFFMYKFWDRVAAYWIIMKCVGKQEGYYKTPLNLELMQEYCEWDKDIFENNFKKKCCLRIKNWYVNIYDYIVHFNCICGKVGG